jgi:micrococcal nuclease
MSHIYCRCTVACLLVVVVTPFVAGHGGGLDSRGGHNDRKKGGYHYHRGGGRSVPRPSVTFYPFFAPTMPRAKSAPDKDDFEAAERRREAARERAKRKREIAWKRTAKLPAPRQAAVLARVVRVVDGDTLVAEETNPWFPGPRRQYTIRLEGIDAPEMKQEFGPQAKRALNTLAGKIVELELSGKDNYGRHLAHVYAGKLHINAQLIRWGYAWHYAKYNDDELLKAQQVYAKANRRGLWATPSAITPWDFRKTNA